MMNKKTVTITQTINRAREAIYIAVATGHGTAKTAIGATYEEARRKINDKSK